MNVHLDGLEIRILKFYFTMLDIISIGSSTLDIFIPVPFRSKLPIGSKLKVGEAILCGGGGAHNSVVTFKRNGLRTKLITRVGTDVFGDEIEKIIAKQKISSHIVRDAKGPSGVSYILLDGKGDQTILSQRGISGAFSIRELSRIPRSHWAYLSTGAIPLPVLSKLVRMLHERGTHVAINPSSEMLAHGFVKIKPILNKSRVVQLNRKEAAELTNTSLRERKEIFKRLDKEVLGIAIMTDGAHGVSVSDGATILSSRAVRVKRIADMTGAGDAFGSAFVTALIKKGENCEKGACKPAHLSYALHAGIRNAASVIRFVGATEGIGHI